MISGEIHTFIRLNWFDKEEVKIQIKTLSIPTKQLILEKAKEKLNEEQLEQLREDLMFVKFSFEDHGHYKSLLKQLTGDFHSYLQIICLN